MNPRNELYFKLYLTESEHTIVAQQIRDYSNDNDLKLVYYRKLKTGHVPLWREVKIQGNIGKFKKWAADSRLILSKP